MSSASLKNSLLSTSAFVFLFALTAVHCGAQSIEQAANGAIIHSKIGIVQVEVCSESVIHILAGAKVLPAGSLVPAVIRPCSGAKFTASSDNLSFLIQTGKLKIKIAKDTGRVSFLTSGGSGILHESPRQGRPVALTGIDDSAPAIEQQFQLSPGEALYGLGQHQEGFFNLRDIPLRLLQANTNIAIPFLVSTKGYGLLWNNAALTDFNPTAEVIPLDNTGAANLPLGAGRGIRIPVERKL